MQAAAENVLDFRQARLLDPRWWQRLFWVCDHLARKNRKEVHYATLLRDLAVLNYDLPQDAFTRHWDGANTSIADISNAVLPWVDAKPPTVEEIANRMYHRYVDEFGQPGDPEHDAEVQKLLDYWNDPNKVIVHDWD